MPTANGLLSTVTLDSNADGVFDTGDATFTFGLSTDTMVVGDWNASGFDGVGVERGSLDGAAQWTIDTNENGAFDSGDSIYTYGLNTDTPVTGDWTGSGTTKIGVVQPLANGAAQWVLNTTGTGVFSSSDTLFTYGLGSDTFITGDWNGAGLPANLFNVRQDYASSADDVRHRMTASISYALPEKKGFAQLLEGWKINSVVNVQTALPWTVTDATDDISDPICPAVFIAPEIAPTCSRPRSMQIDHETGIITFKLPPPRVNRPTAIVLLGVIVAKPRQIPAMVSPAAPTAQRANLRECVRANRSLKYPPPISPMKPNHAGSEAAIFIWSSVSPRPT